MKPKSDIVYGQGLARIRAKLKGGVKSKLHYSVAEARIRVKGRAGRVSGWDLRKRILNMSLEGT